MPKNGDPILKRELQEAEIAWAKADKAMWRAKDDLAKAKEAYYASTECSRCGIKGGSSVCGEADRLVFACDNWMGPVS